MIPQKRKALMKKFNVRSVGGGAFGTGFLEGLQYAEKQYKKKKGS